MLLQIFIHALKKYRFIHSWDQGALVLVDNLWSEFNYLEPLHVRMELIVVYEYGIG